jgi:hypothetical protein
MKEKTINGLISRFEDEIKYRADHQCVFMSVGEMKLVIKTLRRFKLQKRNASRSSYDKSNRCC